MPVWRDLGSEALMRGSRIFKHLLRDARGTSAVEYGFILGLIVIGLLVVITGLGAETQKMWNSIASQSAKAHNVSN
jgi:pilus assembly protein Flp/PilA